ncbi:MAG: SPOR domain-containing protein [Deltaproteobacteria bacterium]|nr:SPOR domain-containing protein [Deltaproteobacteria bacterium]
MTKKVLVALGFVAAIIILLVFYFFYSGAPPFKGMEKPKTPEVKSQAAPEVKEKPTPAPALPPSPAPPEKPQPQPGAPPEKSLTKPEAASPAPEKTLLPPLEPKKESGLLAGSYRRYADAAKMMEKLKKQGQPAFIRREKGKYQVWVGPFSTPEEAQAAAKALKGKAKIPSKIHQIETPVPK